MAVAAGSEIAERHETESLRETARNLGVLHETARRTPRATGLIPEWYDDSKLFSHVPSGHWSTRLARATVGGPRGGGIDCERDEAIWLHRGVGRSVWSGVVQRRWFLSDVREFDDAATALYDGGESLASHLLFCFPRLPAILTRRLKDDG